MIPKRVVVRLIGAAVAGLAVLSGPVATAGAAGPRHSAEATKSVLHAADGTGVELNLTKVSPAAVGPDDDVVVTGTVRNLGTTALNTVRVSLWLRPDVLPDRKAIDTWLADPALVAGDEELSDGDVVVRGLASGATSAFSFKIAPGDTGLTENSDFGPRAIALQARTGGRRLALLPSTIVWAPSDITTPTRLSVMVPMTATTPSTHAGEPNAEIAKDLLPGGRLERVLRAAQNPGMAWAIDPAVLTAAQRLISGGIDRKPDDADLTVSGTAQPDEPEQTAAADGAAAISDTAAKSGAQSWLTAFQTEHRGRGLFGLPYADPDLTSVLKSSRGMPLLRTSDALGKAATMEALGGPIDTTLAWPADGRINVTTARSLVKLKRTSVILASDVQRPEPKLDYTPTGRSTVRTSAGSLDGLLYDEQLSTLIGTSGSKTPAATQTLLAQLAAITMEQSGSARHVLAVTPRTWSPDPAATRNLMNALGSAQWISLRGISELKDASGPPREAPVYRKAVVKAELPIGSISAAQVLDKGLSTFAPILVDPAPVQPLRERVASLLSVAWRLDRDELVPARIDVAADVNQLVDGVRLGTSNYLFTAKKNNIPVTVINDTAYKIKVVVRLKPLTGQLTIAKTETVEVGPQQTAPVLMKAEAVASGNVTVEGKLLSTTGVALGPGKNFTVRVRPDWESWAMIVIGTILGFLLVIGLLRSIRRNRTRTPVPIGAVPDVDELATSRATVEAEMVGASVGAAAVGAGTAGGWASGTGSAAYSPPIPNPLPDPVPVPISMPGPEPDPKARGGSVKMDGVRPPMKPRVRGRAVRPG